MTTIDAEPVGSVQPTAAAAAAEIERLKSELHETRRVYREITERLSADLYEERRVVVETKKFMLACHAELLESERQRKILAEQLERIGRAGIDAAAGAGK